MERRNNVVTVSFTLNVTEAHETHFGLNATENNIFNLKNINLIGMTSLYASC